MARLEEAELDFVLFNQCPERAQCILASLAQACRCRGSAGYGGQWTGQQARAWRRQAAVLGGALPALAPVVSDRGSLACHGASQCIGCRQLGGGPSLQPGRPASQRPEGRSGRGCGRA